MRKYILYILLLFIVGCKSKVKDKDDYEEIDLVGKLYPIEILARGFGLWVLGDYLLVVTPNEPLFRVYEKEGEFRQVTTYGTRGRGPGEFYHARVTTILGDTIIVHDGQKRHLTALIFDKETMNIRKLNVLTHERRKEPRSELHVADRYIAKLSNQNYVGGSPMDHNKMFSYLDSELNLITHFGEFPFFKGADVMSLRNYAQGWLSVKGNNILYSMNRLPYVVMYEAKDGQVHKKWDDNIYPLEVEIRGTSILFDRDDAKGTFHGSAMGEKYIYLLFCDGYLRDDGPGKGSNIIYVYNYTGDKVAKLNLDHDLLNWSICLSEDEKTLYGVTEDSLLIVEYDISDLMK